MPFGDQYECCCCALCICCVLPILIGSFFFYTASSNTRTQDIETYNKYASMWQNQSMFDYNGLFFVSVVALIDPEDNETIEQTGILNVSYTKEGTAYPYRDKVQNEDPDFVDYTPKYYETIIKLPLHSENLSISIYTCNSVPCDEEDLSKRIILYNTIYNRTDEYTAIDIDCLTSGCNEKCTSRNGTWFSDQAKCFIPVVLKEFCIRIVKNNNGKWIWDKGDDDDDDIINNNLKTEYDEGYVWKNKDKGGCRYDKMKNEMSPSFYGLIDNTNNLLIRVRKSIDPYSICDDLTKGCTSMNNDSTANCFGVSLKSNIYTGAIMFAYGLFASLVITLCFVFKVKSTTVPDTDIEVSVLSVFQLSQKN